jgi:hypothetical protein
LIPNFRGLPIVERGDGTAEDVARKRENAARARRRHEKCTDSNAITALMGGPRSAR